MTRAAAAGVGGGMDESLTLLFEVVGYLADLCVDLYRASPDAPDRRR